MEDNKNKPAFKVPTFTFKKVSELLNLVRSKPNLTPEQRGMYGKVIKDSAARESSRIIGQNIDKKA